MIYTSIHNSLNSWHTSMVGFTLQYLFIWFVLPFNEPYENDRARFAGQVQDSVRSRWVDFVVQSGAAELNSWFNWVNFMVHYTLLHNSARGLHFAITFMLTWILNVVLHGNTSTTDSTFASFISWNYPFEWKSMYITHYISWIITLRIALALYNCITSCMT